MTKIKLTNGVTLDAMDVELLNGILKITTADSTVEELATLFSDKKNTSRIVLLTPSGAESGYKYGFTSFAGISYGVDGVKTIELFQPVDELESRVSETEGNLVDTNETLNTLLGTENASVQSAEQSRRALQMFAQTLPEDQALEISTVYPVYVVGKAYVVNEMFTYGTNKVGDPQLYKVVQDHTSQDDWKPDTTPSLYVAIGLNDSGYPVWSQPTGAHDAYNKGDVVDYNGTLYESLIDGNTYSPEAYPAGWEVYSE